MISLQTKLLAFFSSNRRFYILMAVLLALPLFFSAPPYRPMATEPPPPSLDWPRVYSGDEPHYLIMLNSLLKDGDLNLKNNYDSVHSGSWQAGRLFAWSALDHHTSWPINGKIWNWIELVKGHGSSWLLNPDGSLRYEYLSELPAPLSTFDIERTWHPPAMAFLLAPFLYPLKDTRGGVESGAVIFSTLLSFFALIALQTILISLLAATEGSIPTSITPAIEARANFATAVIFLGTPLWHYGRTIFTEPFITSFITIGYALAIRYRAEILRGNILSGILFGLSMILKPPSALIGIPVGIDRLLRKDFKAALALLVGPLLGFIALLKTNAWMTGSATTAYAGVTWGDPVTGLFGLLFSPKHGLLAFAPAALLIVPGWAFLLFKRRNRDAVIALVGGLAYFIFMVFWDSWHGGYCYGPRMILPTLPLLLIGILPSFYQKSKKGALLPISKVALALIILSVFINLLGSAPYYKYWNSHPLFEQWLDRKTY